MPIGARAAERAKQRSEETGVHYTPTDYLVESLAKPDAYLVDTYKNEMAIVYAPPISLNLKEIKAVISYLQSQGGDVDLESIEQPSEIASQYYGRIAAASAAGGGDPGNGEEMFVDTCSDCHMLKGEGGNIGPDLSTISERGLKFITESILRPAKKITPGYETYVAVDNEGIKTIGLKTRDTESELDITKVTGEVVTLAKSDIKGNSSRTKVPVWMPDDLTRDADGQRLSGCSCLHDDAKG